MGILLGQHRFALAILHCKGQETVLKKKKGEREGERIVLSLHIPELLHTYYLTRLLTQSLSLMHFSLNTDIYSSTPKWQLLGLM